MKIGIPSTEPTDRDSIVQLLQDYWGDVNVVSRGTLHDASALPGFVPVANNQVVGLITNRIDGSNCEIVTLNSLRENAGIGTGLIEAVTQVARQASIRRIWLITTNDNLHAISFYQRRGFRLVAVHRNAVEESRKLKPRIPATGIDGVPIRDEIELELLIDWL